MHVVASYTVVEDTHFTTIVTQNKQQQVMTATKCTVSTEQLRILATTPTPQLGLKKIHISIPVIGYRLKVWLRTTHGQTNLHAINLIHQWSEGCIKQLLCLITQ